MKEDQLDLVASEEQTWKKITYVSLQSISLSNGRMRSDFSMEDLVFSSEFEVELWKRNVK